MDPIWVVLELKGIENVNGGIENVKGIENVNEFLFSTPGLFGRT